MENQNSKKLQIIITVVVFIAVVVAVVLYQTHTAKVTQQNVTPTTNRDELDRQKMSELQKISNSLTVQPQTPEFKAKLEEMSKSLSH